MAKNFNLLKAKLSPEAQARIKAGVEKYEAEMALDELRVARRMTQQNLADLLGINQASLSKMERQTDMYISSLRSIIGAMGGYLKLEAVFPPGRRVTISQFEALDEVEVSKVPSKPRRHKSSKALAPAGR